MKNRIPLKIALIYFVIGFLWILCSDNLLSNLTDNHISFSHIQTYKGWIFVSATSILIFFLVRREIRKKIIVENKLREAKARTEEAERLKAAFLSNMSHEIRTPLNGILGFSSLLQDNSYSQNEKMIFIDLINRNGKELMNKIDDIVDISRIQEDQLVLNIKRTNLHDLLDELYHHYRISDSRLQSNKIDFTLEKATEEPFFEIMCDAERLRQILRNLISNSLKFTESGKISFGYKFHSSYIEFYVEDTGIGIDKDANNFIFSHFFQEERKYLGIKGFGLGLAISKGLVDIMGGSIAFDSEVNKGSRFYFRIPKSKLLPKEKLVFEKI